MSPDVDETVELTGRLDALLDKFAQRNDWTESFLLDVYEKDWVMGLSVLKTPKSENVVPRDVDYSFPDTEVFDRVPIAVGWMEPPNRATAVVITTKDGAFALEASVEDGWPAVRAEMIEGSENLPRPYAGPVEGCDGGYWDKVHTQIEKSVFAYTNPYIPENNRIGKVERGPHSRKADWL